MRHEIGHHDAVGDAEGARRLQPGERSGGCRMDVDDGVRPRRLKVPAERRGAQVPQADHGRRPGTHPSRQVVSEAPQPRRPAERGPEQGERAAPESRRDERPEVVDHFNLGPLGLERLGERAGHALVTGTERRPQDQDSRQQWRRRDEHRDDPISSGAEAPVSLLIAPNCPQEVYPPEGRPVHVAEVKLAVRALPEEEAGEPDLARRADDEIGIG